MPVDIEDGNAATVDITGTPCVYVLSVIVDKDLEMSLYSNDASDLGELKTALEEALRAKQAMILLRADTPGGVLQGWKSLDPVAFAPRLPRA